MRVQADSPPDGGEGVSVGTKGKRKVKKTKHKIWENLYLATQPEKRKILKRGRGKVKNRGWGGSIWGLKNAET